MRALPCATRNLSRTDRLCINRSCAIVKPRLVFTYAKCAVKDGEVRDYIPTKIPLLQDPAHVESKSRGTRMMHLTRGGFTHLGGKSAVRQALRDDHAFSPSDSMIARKQAATDGGESHVRKINSEPKISASAPIAAIR